MAYMCKIWQATECNGCGGCLPPEEEEQEDEDGEEFYEDSPDEA